MAKNTLLTIDGTHRKVKNQLITIDNIYHKIKKAYISVGGFYRPFMNSEPEYWGQATPLEEARSNISSASAGDYVLFAGGHNPGVKYIPAAGYEAYTPSCCTIDAYNKDLSHSTMLLDIPLENIGAASVGDYAIFAGGCEMYGGPLSSGITHIYEKTTLSRYYSEQILDLQFSRSDMASVSTDKYAIFAGGISYIDDVYDDYYGTYVSIYSDYNHVDAYDKTLTKSYTSLSSQRNSCAGACVGNNAIIAGGCHLGTRIPMDTITEVFNVDVINENLTCTEIEPLELGISYTKGLTLSNHAVFFTGSKGCLFNQDFTRSIVNLYFYLEMYHAATVLNDYAFCLSTDPLGRYVDVYDNNFTFVKNILIPTEKDSYIGACCGGSVGNYALFAGGIENNKNQYQSTVEVFTV